MIKPAILITALAVTTSSAFADEMRFADTHEHGQAIARITLDYDDDGVIRDHDLDVKIFGAAQSFVGFEYHPQNPIEKQMITKLNQDVRSGNLIAINKEAGCRLDDTDFDFDTHGDHADIEIELDYECQNPENLTSVTFNFANMQYADQLKAQYIDNMGEAASGVVTPKNTVFNIK
ncbi:MAG: DUF2796 domain-containing protein [Alphaproteobacteria bacterium]